MVASQSDKRYHLLAQSPSPSPPEAVGSRAIADERIPTAFVSTTAVPSGVVRSRAIADERIRTTPLATSPQRAAPCQDTCTTHVANHLTKRSGSTCPTMVGYFHMYISTVFPSCNFQLCNRAGMQCHVLQQCWWARVYPRATVLKVSILGCGSCAKA